MIVGGAGTKTGVNWENAYEFLDDALADVNEPLSEVNLVRIAGGTYKPSGTNGSFVIEKACTIEGGYRGYTDQGGDADDRDLVAYATILSGDLDDDDDGSPGSMVDNSFHVIDITVAVENHVTLDGLTVTGGNALNESVPADRVGGGVRSRASGESTLLYLSDCQFLANWANDGGGVYVFPGLRCRRCLFEGNRVTPTPVALGAQVGAGGGLSAIGNVHVVECDFLDNKVLDQGYGGAVAIGAGATFLTNSTFRGNMVDGSNLPAGGGAIMLGTRSMLEVSGCVVANNAVMATGYGGGIYCIGAVEHNSGEQLRLLNSTLANNSVGGTETAPGNGGGAFGAMIRVNNSIVFGNTNGGTSVFEAQLSDQTQDWVILSSCVEGIYLVDFPGNTTDDPQFIDPDDGNYRLDRCSPLIDAGGDVLLPIDVTDVNEAGSPTELLPWDRERNDRILGAHVDMGAYEYVPPPCPADLNDDGVVNGADLGLVLANWGACAGCPADLNCDDVVDGADLGLVLAAWGDCPGGESMMMGGGGSESESSEISPAAAAEAFGFESVEEFVEWLSGLEFSTMSALLEGLFGS